MICRKCGIEIADKALICYRCGTATREPVHAPAPTDEPQARPVIPIVLALAMLGLAAFFLAGAPNGAPVPPVVWVMLATAGGLLAWRLWRR